MDRRLGIAFVVRAAIWTEADNLLEVSQLTLGTFVALALLWCPPIALPASSDTRQALAAMRTYSVLVIRHHRRGGQLLGRGRVDPDRHHQADRRAEVHRAGDQAQDAGAARGHQPRRDHAGRGQRRGALSRPPVRPTGRYFRPSACSSTASARTCSTSPSSHRRPLSPTPAIRVVRRRRPDRLRRHTDREGQPRSLRRMPHITKSDWFAAVCRVRRCGRCPGR